MMTILAACLVLLATGLVVAPLFRPAANRAMGLGVESRDPVARWQHEKDRLTDQLRDNDIALAEGRIDAAVHGRNNARLAAEAEGALKALRRAREAFAPAALRDTHMPGGVASALTAACIVAAAFGVSAVASSEDIDMTRSPHEDGGVPIATPAGMPVDADGAPDIAAMVARLEARVWDGDASPDDYRMLLRSYGVLGREAEAPEVLKAAADQYPDDLEFRMNYLRMVVESPDAPPAVELLAQVEDVLEAVPDMAEARWYRSLLNLQLGRPTAAKTDLEWLVVRLQPDHPAAGEVRTLLTEIGGGKP
ncbi:hypothetical protein D6850_15205 [Roseovarius spongiae]|uniref:C-type cytochrome biogenesis protein CcmI n=1 Tax=Roseovarius spongiae TaxID=2320272 RepID=A0A3A8B7P2_9RHOB|nr:hypothetical protein [Roseovarius spongiae]RKF12857.1 hypothetical protein D6850_15205 [Roseovarius spongiae]